MILHIKLKFLVKKWFHAFNKIKFRHFLKNWVLLCNTLFVECSDDYTNYETENLTKPS